MRQYNIDRIDPRTWTSEVAFHFDCEFIDTGAAVDLVSIGGVFLGKGIYQEFYGINSEFLTKPSFLRIADESAANAEWLLDNVFSKISVIPEGSKRTVSLASLASPQGLTKKIARIPTKYQPGCVDIDAVVGTPADIASALNEVTQHFANRRIQSIGWYPAYDMVMLAGIFGGLMKMPDQWRMSVWDMKTVMDMYEFTDKQFPVNCPHHALLDAIEQSCMWNNVIDAIKFAQQE